MGITARRARGGWGCGAAAAESPSAQRPYTRPPGAAVPGEAPLNSLRAAHARAVPGGDLEVRRGRRDDRPRGREGAPPVAGAGEDDVQAVGPDGVERAIGADRAGEALHAAVVVAREPALGADAFRRGPGDTVIGRA